MMNNAIALLVMALSVAIAAYAITRIFDAVAFFWGIK